jgi:hypothetical protein
MKGYLLVLAAATIMVGVTLMGCGGGETKTVTETTTSAAEGAPPPQESISEEAQADITGQPTSTSIPDGTWKLGEYTSGEYRAPGGSRCWWEKLKKLGEESLMYGSEETNILVDIDTPYFKTEHCGVWRKVG